VKPVELHVERGRLKATGDGSWVGEAPYGGLEDLAETVGTLSREMPRARWGRRPSVRITIHPPVAQTRTLEGLPSLRPGDLRALVAEQASRFFRGSRDELVTNAGRQPGTSGNVVRAAAVDRHTLELLIGATRDSGLSVGSVGTPVDGAWLELLPERERAEQRRRRLRSLALHAAVVALAWLATAGWYVASLRTERQRLDRELAALRPATTALASLDRESRLAARMLQAVEVSRADYLRLLAQLHAVILALPDSAYLTTVSLSARGPGSVTGMARRPTEGLSAFRAQAGLADARLKTAGPHIPTPQAPWGEFTIQFGKDTVK